MIPVFPQFKKLDLSSRKEIVDLVSKFPTYTEFSFTDMFVWYISDPIEVSLLHDNLIIKVTDFLKNDHFYSILGENKLEDSIEALLELSEKENCIPTLCVVPHSVASKVEGSTKFDIIEDRNNHDYILAVEDLVHFKSEKFREKRNMINRFTNKNTEVDVRFIDLSNPENAKEVRAVLEKWESKIPRDAVDIIVEFSAIEKSLMHGKDLNIQCLATYVNNQVEAFTIFEVIDDKNVMMHFEKANRQFKGIYEFQKHHLAKNLEKIGIEFINYGQDIGLEGLRASKLSYHPVKFHKKYTIGKRTTSNLKTSPHTNDTSKVHEKALAL